MPSVPDFDFSHLTPDWVEALLDKPYSHFSSILVDRWLDYVASEFEGVKP